MRNYGNIFKFLRSSDLIERRMRINGIGRQVSDIPYLYHFSVKEVREILERAEIDVCVSTVRRWISIGLLTAFKKSKKKTARWHMMPCHVRELEKRLHTMSQAYEDYREAVERERKERRPQYVIQEHDPYLRDRNGRFMKKVDHSRDHDQMTPRLI